MDQPNRPREQLVQPAMDVQITLELRLIEITLAHATEDMPNAQQGYRIQQADDDRCSQSASSIAPMWSRTDRIIALRQQHTGRLDFGRSANSLLRRVSSTRRQIPNRQYVEFRHTASTPVLRCCTSVFRRDWDEHDR
ncbi:hypothetical protein [Nocardia nepalensis]|uniref:hypothetical protein n=1 Tax=Nocardia nepalensis TaxID=3375448 RepID=UPI003B66D150